MISGCMSTLFNRTKKNDHKINNHMINVNILPGHKVDMKSLETN